MGTMKRSSHAKQMLAIQLLLCALVFDSFVYVSRSFAAEMPAGEKRTAIFRLYASYMDEFPEVRGISALQAMALHRRGAVVFVDVRKPAEMEISTLPGAVGADAFRAHPDRYRGRTAVAYCTIGYRSGLFAKKMAEQGVPVFNLEGGILAWLWEGGELLDAGGGAVKRVHVYAQKWDLAPPGYETIRFGFWQRLFIK